MIRISSKENCCGCSACSNVCGQHAITMQSDDEGFLYPIINQKLCTGCGICDKVCPISNPKEKKPVLQKAYLVQHKNQKILKESTSGGAFTAIASCIIKKGGVVFGAAFDKDFHVIHTSAETEADLRKFRNSKYVQSDLGDTFRQVRSFLKAGRLVCYSGTPCQIEGLKKFLMKEYENLITVDVVCRAVPSPGVWEKYLEYINKKDLVTSVRFRDKTFGYQFSTMELITASGKVIRGGIDTQTWLRMFFSGMIIRPSCTEYRFRSHNRISDITIWDCFNIYKLSKEFDEDCGTTRVLTHTDIGRHIIDECALIINIKEIEVQEAIQGVKEMKKSPSIHVKKKEFFRDFNNMEFEYLLEKYFPNTLIVRIKGKTRLFLNKVGFDKTIKHILKKGLRTSYGKRSYQHNCANL